MIRLRVRWLIQASLLFWSVPALSQSSHTTSVAAAPPGVFFNTHSGRFIYAPSFNFPGRSYANSYRFTIRSLTDGRSQVFTADEPTASLAPVWPRLPIDSLLLMVEAVGDGEQTVPVAERRFIKSPGFEAVDATETVDYLEAGMRSLDSLFRSPRIQYWLEHGEPNPDYPLWVYPAKVMGATIRGMVHLSQGTDDPEVREKALAAAQKTADFMLNLREPKGSPLAGWPPVHWAGVEPENHPVYEGEFMVQFPAEAGWALLDLFDATGDQQYYEAVVEIADRYVDLQRDDGTWFLLLYSDTGLPGRRKNPVVPVYMIELFDRLESEYGETRYRFARSKAFEWIRDHPLSGFAWEAQFEDTRPKPSLQNLAYREATLTAKLLFQDPETVELAKLVLRFVEDQFVVWAEGDPVLFRNWFSPKNRHWNGNHPVTGKDWFLPAVLEQYAFYTPISGAAATVMDAYVTASSNTGESHYLQRARALANSIVAAQTFHGRGEIPTHMRRSLPEKNWTNVGVHAALKLIEHAEVLEGRR
jgi:hypothetical protein